MPRYDYICENCEGDYIFELKQSFDSKPVANCPICGNLSKRKFSSVPIVFKGSGWYVNDYGKKSSASTGASTSDIKDTSSNNDSKDSKVSKISDNKSANETKAKASKSSSKSPGK